MSEINREEAIRIIASYPGPVDKSVVRRLLTQMPKAGQEIIRCRDCKHHDGIRCFRWNSVIITGFNDFCSNAERRDEQDE